MAAKGTIEKELSYIMGIPSSTEDIGTYDDLIKRLEENREFRVKVLKNDTEIKRDMNESLEEKVFRSGNNPEARIEAAGAAFEIGKERIAFLKIEEEEIIKLEEALGIEANENRVFLGQKFDEVYDKFNSNNNEIELLLLENEKLKEYLIRLDKMEQKVKTGNQGEKIHEKN